MCSSIGTLSLGRKSGTGASFINDEAPALSGWAHATFGGFNAAFYGHVYELILRLGGNFLWPAMWGHSLWDDDPRSAALADEYGVVLGTSHHEPMERAHVEWERYGTGPWNYGENETRQREFWRQGIERRGRGGVGAVQGGPGVLRPRHDRPRRCHAPLRR